MENIIEKVKTFEEAQALTGRNDVPEFSELPEDLREYFKAQYKAVVITEALNEGWRANWEDISQKKWYPWFSVSPSGFVFDVTDDDYSIAFAGNASRLCFKSEELAEYSGKQFVKIWSEILNK